MNFHDSWVLTWTYDELISSELSYGCLPMGGWWRSCVCVFFLFLRLSFTLWEGVGGRVYTLQIRSGLAHACLTVGNPTVSDSWPTFLEERDGAAAFYPRGASRRRVEEPPHFVKTKKRTDLMRTPESQVRGSGALIPQPDALN